MKLRFFLLCGVLSTVGSIPVRASDAATTVELRSALRLLGKERGDAFEERYPGKKSSVTGLFFSRSLEDEAVGVKILKASVPCGQVRRFMLATEEKAMLELYVVGSEAEDMVWFAAKYFEQKVLVYPAHWQVQDESGGLRDAGRLSGRELLRRMAPSQRKVSGIVSFDLGCSFPITLMCVDDVCSLVVEDGEVCC